MIPRIVHHLWLGPKAVPSVFQRYVDSWRRHSPGWEMRLWRDETLPTLSCQAEYDREKDFKKRYDIARLEIVRQCGGVIVDMDVEAIRPLDPLLPGVTAFVGRIGSRHIGNQVLGAVPHHPFFEEAARRVRLAMGTDVSASELAGKEFLRRLLAEHPDGVTVFPAETFYFEPSSDPPRRPDDFPHVYAVHHELQSYAAPLAADVIEERFGQFATEVARVLAAEDPIARERARERQIRAERRLRRAILQQDQGYQAMLRRAEIEREQLVARLEEARHEGRSLAGWARSVAARLTAMIRPR